MPRLRQLLLCALLLTSLGLAAVGVSGVVAAAVDVAAGHVEEMLTVRSVAGVVGGIGLLTLVLVRRRRPEWFAVDRLPVAFTEAVAALSFGLAAVVLLALAVDTATHDGRGVGLWLSGGAMAAVGTIIALGRLRRRTAGVPA